MNPDPRAARPAFLLLPLPAGSAQAHRGRGPRSVPSSRAGREGGRIRVPALWDQPGRGGAGFLREPIPGVTAQQRASSEAIESLPHICQTGKLRQGKPSLNWNEWQVVTTLLCSQAPDAAHLGRGEGRAEGRGPSIHCSGSPRRGAGKASGLGPERGSGGTRGAMDHGQAP